MTLQEKGSRTLSSPGAGFLSGPGVSNIRSPPPCVPSEGQASHFPFRKGQSKRPGEAHQEEREGGGPGLALPAGVGTLAPPHTCWPRGLLAHLPVCLPSFTLAFTHSFNRHFDLPALGQALCSQGAHGIWEETGIR